MTLTGKLKKRYSEFEVPFKKASVLIVASINRNFIAGGRPTKWEPLSFITRLVRGQKAKPLRASGRLQSSITPYTDVARGMFGAITNVPYAKLMHSGGTSEGGTAEVPSRKVPAFTRVIKTREGQRTIKVKAHTRKAYTIKIKPSPVPARPFMMTQREDLPRIRAIFKEHLNGRQQD